MKNLRNAMKRLLSLLLSLALIASLAACGANDESSASVPESKGSSGASDSAPTGEVNKYGWEVPTETLKFSYFYADDDTLAQDEEDKRLAYTAQVLKDEFNVEIQRIVYKQDPTERLNLMLAGDDYPDVISVCRTLWLKPLLTRAGPRNWMGFWSNMGRTLSTVSASI